MSILIDTGIFYALLDKGDANYMDALAIVAHVLEGKFGKAITTDYVILETTLLLKARIGPEVVKAFLDFLEQSGITTIIIDEETFKKALKLLKKHPKSLSLCDAATLTIIKDWSINNLATFNLRSFKNLTANIVGKGYFNTLNSDEKEKIKSLTKTDEPKKTAKHLQRNQLNMKCSQRKQ